MSEATKTPKKETDAIAVNRDSLTYVGPGLFIYSHPGDLSACKTAGAFQCIHSKNLGLRVGDVVICKNEKESINIVVQEIKEKK
nr:hypothetical protein BHI3_07620 [Bacteriovorax sp. HI3]